MAESQPQPQQQQQRPGWEHVNLTKFYAYNTVFFIAQSLALYPMEVIKTRVQIAKDMAPPLKGVPPQKLSLPHHMRVEFRQFGAVCRQVVREGGPKGLFRGFLWYTVPTAMAEGVYYSSYNATKHAMNMLALRFGDTNSHLHPPHSTDVASTQVTPSATIRAMGPFIAGFVAEGVITPLNVPLDMVTQRLMIMPAHIKHGGVKVASDLLKEGGVRDMFRGTTLHVVTYGTASMFWFGTYEICKRFFARFKPVEQAKANPVQAPQSSQPATPIMTATPPAESPSASDGVMLKALDIFGGTDDDDDDEDDHNLTLADHVVHCSAGLVAGTVSCLASNPLDVIKTRVQVAGSVGCEIAHDPHGRHNAPSTVLRELRTLLAKEGATGFLRGVLPRIIMTAPQSALALVLYEIAFAKSIEFNRS